MSKKEKTLEDNITRLLKLEIMRGSDSITKIGDTIQDEIDKFEKDTPCDINNGYIIGLNFALDIVNDVMLDYTVKSVEILLDCKEVFKND